MEREVKLVRALALLSFGASWVLATVAVCAQAASPCVPAAFVALALLAWLAVLARRRAWVPGVVLGVAVLNALVTIPELALRLRGFSYETGIQFGYPRPQAFRYLQPDSLLFWKPRPQDPGVNSLGFRGKEPLTPKPPSVTRVLFFGDSVTEQGLPDVVEAILTTGNCHRTYECVSLAVAGYSSHQGKVLVDLYGHSLEPDAAVILFGWNDHYLAYGAPDARKQIPAGSRLAPAFSHQLKLAQWVLFQTHRLRRTLPQPSESLRVSPQEYRDNLRYMGLSFLRRGLPVIYLTSPTSHAMGVPDYLVDKGFARTKDRVASLHRHYNTIVREVSGELGAVVVDLEALVDSLPPPRVLSLFMRDGIHLTSTGLAVVATQVARALCETLENPRPPTPPRGGAKAA